MKRTFVLTLVILGLITAGVVIFASLRTRKVMVSNQNSAPQTNTSVNTNAPAELPAVNTNVVTQPVPRTVVTPIASFYNRVTKKPFGIHITPATSPVQPEKFHGYHTGADAEVNQDEGSIDVPVYAIADGTVMLVSYLRGYGGVIMIRHIVDRETVTALYGHIRQSSVLFKVGDTVHVADQIAVLGTGYIAETQGERKHLHFGLLKGASRDTRGYVGTEKELGPWLDPVVWLQDKAAQAPR